MDSINAQHVPVLCYTLNQIDPDVYPSLPMKVQQNTMTQFPNLARPEVLASLARAINNSPQLTHTLSFLRSLGPRPDHSALGAALSKIAEIEAKLRKGLQVVENGGGDGDKVDVVKELKEGAEREIQIYKAVVKMEDVHNECEKQLRDLEESLLEVYESVIGELKDSSSSMEFGEDVNQELVDILKKAETEEVERVVLSGRELRFLPESLGKIQGLVVLNLSHNRLELLPDSIAGLQKLEELDVSSNLLSSLPDSTGLLLNLRVLNVSGNQLKALPESISHCRSLVELDASFNNLMSLPSNMGTGLIDLERLLIQLNKIRYLPASVGEMRSLRYLDIHFNELHALPNSIGRLVNLEFLNVGSNFNDLMELPETIGDLVNMRELDLSNNQIRALPYTFRRLAKLTMLNLDQNPIELPPCDVVEEGIEAVRNFMNEAWLELIAEEQEKSLAETEKQETQTGWLAWGTSLLSNLVSDVSHSATGHPTSRKADKDPWLDEML